MVRRARAMASRSVVARMVIRAPRAREGAHGAGLGAPRSGVGEAARLRVGMTTRESG